MILFITLAILVVGLILMLMDTGDSFEVGAFTIIVSGLAIFMLLMVMVCNSIGLDADIEKLQIRYDAIMYQCENDIYKDDLIGKRGLVEDIMEWNQEVTWNKKMRKNFWFGILCSKKYDNFDTIDISHVLDN